jgi:hypothetical protein
MFKPMSSIITYNPLEERKYDEDWELVEENEVQVDRSSTIMVVFVLNFNHLFELFTLLGNNCLRVSVSPYENIILNTGFCEVRMPPGIFVVLLDSNSVNIKAMEGSFSERLMFPLIIPETFWRYLTEGSSLRMRGLLMSQQIVYPPLHQWHFMEPLYREAGMHFPRSLSCIVRDEATSALNNFLLSVAGWIGAMLR